LKAEFRFEKLEVWQRAVALAGAVYRFTAAFPRDEQFGLTMQMRRASVSVGSNIAEGCSRSSRRDQSRFYEIAYGSLNELATQIHIARELGYSADDAVHALLSEVSDICRMLSGLRRSLSCEHPLSSSPG
jgi:four helix bundle protein